MGYFYYLIGITEAQDNINSSEKNMKKALDYGLSFKHDRAMAKLSLAGASMAKGRKQEAQILLREAKDLDDRGMFIDQIYMMKEQMQRINVCRKLHTTN